ncbi:phosphatase PAP2 family protein [Lacticaseibacillus kribbianus]|uniref:phosphatase PAP2 family protein n=1 Tax=Lacticaseibacillus kribbianus TaxID=2926292 RepID=UPI001CD7D174|nr:phosphatase PAP2 family protein [Lacticaseibacillus kribbianus]
MMSHRSNVPLALAALGLAIFIPLLWGVAHHAAFIGAIDDPIIAAVTATRPTWLTDILLTITALGEPAAVTLLGVVLAAILAYYRRRRYAVFAALSIVGMSGFNTVVKHAIRRLRPFVQDPTITPLTRIGGYSFPSGHASGSLLLWGTVILLSLTLITNAPVRRWFVGIALGMIVLTGYSRIYVQVHYPTDVLAGYGLALFGLMMVWWLMQPWLTATTPTGWVNRKPKS